MKYKTLVFTIDDLLLYSTIDYTLLFILVVNVASLFYFED